MVPLVVFGLFKEPSTMPKHTDSFGPAYSYGSYIAYPYHHLGIIARLGFNTVEAATLAELIGWSYKDHGDVCVATETLAKGIGAKNYRIPARAIRKAINKGLLIVTIPNKKDRPRHLDIRPLIAALAELAPKSIKKETVESKIENAITELKPPVRFGEPKYENPPIVWDLDSEDLPDEATRGFKPCKDCHGFLPKEHLCWAA